MTNEEAKQKLRGFGHMADKYNTDGFLDESDSMLKVYQDFGIECLDLFKFLNSKENIEASRAYVIFAQKILLRLSYLIHHKRKETRQEHDEAMASYLRIGPVLSDLAVQS